MLPFYIMYPFPIRLDQLRRRRFFPQKKGGSTLKFLKGFVSKTEPRANQSNALHIRCVLYSYQFCMLSSQYRTAWLRYVRDNEELTLLRNLCGANFQMVNQAVSFSKAAPLIIFALSDATKLIPFAISARLICVIGMPAALSAPCSC